MSYPRKTFANGFTIPDRRDEPPGEEQPNWHNCRRCWVLYFGDAGELCDLCESEEENPV